MKKISVLLLTLFVSSILCNVSVAQINDPLNQSSSKVTDGWSKQDEKPITKKKANKQTEEKVVIIEKTVEVDKPSVKKNQNKLEIRNSCPENLTVELVSLAGNKSSQTVSITIKFTNHGINDTKYIREFIAYNEEGDKFSRYLGGYETLTDIPVKADWEIGQMLPSKNSILTAISFRIGDCTIEMRNVPIDWK